jgi:hypothetical protein
MATNAPALECPLARSSASRSSRSQDALGELLIPRLEVRMAQSTVQWGGRHPKDGGRVLDGRTWDALPLRHVAQAL